ncbi:MAG TPA: hypothetical protein VK826_11420 [Bacteroidia bacterium]|nr:hypothetical protein [Bacteroidia bacterium]
MEELPETDGNFLGFKLIEDDEIVQFMYQDDRGLVLDIPNEGHEAIIDLEQCKQIIRDLYAGKRATDIVSATGG